MNQEHFFLLEKWDDVLMHASTNIQFRLQYIKHLLIK